METPLADLKGIVVESFLPPTKYSFILPENREKFSVCNRHRAEDHHVPSTALIVSGFLKHWRQGYKNRQDFADVLQFSHQIAVVITTNIMSLGNGIIRREGISCKKLAADPLCIWSEHAPTKENGITLVRSRASFSTFILPPLVAQKSDTLNSTLYQT